jgi:hypothetical protein
MGPDVMVRVNDHWPTIPRRGEGAIWIFVYDQCVQATSACKAEFTHVRLSAVDMPAKLARQSSFILCFLSTCFIRLNKTTFYHSKVLQQCRADP